MIIITACTWIVLFLLSSLAFVENSIDYFSSEKDISPAIVPVAQVFAISGLPVNISCFSGQSPLKSCHWERKPSDPNGKRYILFVDEITKKEKHQATFKKDSYNNCNCTYNYIGKGFDKGDCSVAISNSSDFHLAKWECTLIGLDNHKWRGVVNVLPFASKTYFKATDISNKVCCNETKSLSSDVTCCVDSNDHVSPKIKIEWEDQNDVKANLSARIGLFSNYSLRGKQACLHTKHEFTIDDNGKNLVRISSFTYQSQKHTQQAILPVNVTFAPLIALENVTKQVTENNSLLISVPFRANPKPTISWYLKNNPSSGASFEIRKNHVKYKTSLYHHQENNHTTTTLEILNMNTEDYRLEFLLILSNSCGSKELLVTLDNPGSESRPDKYWITILIATAIIMFLVLLTSVLCIIIRHRVKARGKYVPTQVSYSTDADNLQIN